MFRVSKNFSSQIVNQIFVKCNNVHNLQKPSEFLRPNVLSVLHGKESILYLGRKIRDIIPVDMKN